MRRGRDGLSLDTIVSVKECLEGLLPARGSQLGTVSDSRHPRLARHSYMNPGHRNVVATVVKIEKAPRRGLLSSYCAQGLSGDAAALPAEAYQTQTQHCERAGQRHASLQVVDVDVQTNRGVADVDGPEYAGRISV